MQGLGELADHRRHTGLAIRARHADEFGADLGMADDLGTDVTHECVELRSGYDHDRYVEREGDRRDDRDRATRHGVARERGPIDVRAGYGEEE